MTPHARQMQVNASESGNDESVTREIGVSVVIRHNRCKVCTLLATKLALGLGARRGAGAIDASSRRVGDQEEARKGRVERVS